MRKGKPTPLPISKIVDSLRQAFTRFSQEFDMEPIIKMFDHLKFKIRKLMNKDYAVLTRLN